MKIHYVRREIRGELILACRRGAHVVEHTREIDRVTCNDCRRAMGFDPVTDDRKAGSPEGHAHTTGRPRIHGSNAERQAAYRERRAPKIRALIDRYKSRPCADCGKEYPPWVMDLDHVNGEKLFKLADGVGRGGSTQRLESELAKCEVVCANCHRQRSYERGQIPYSGSDRGVS